MATKRISSLLVSASPILLVLVAGQVLLIGVVVWSLMSARHWAIAELATPSSIGNWEAWRDDVRKQQIHPGPVRRRVPQSNEPPALVLLRDYFGISLTGALLFATVLYWVIAWFVTGILRTPQPCRLPPESQD